MNKSMKKLIRAFEKKHKYVDEDGNTDCSIVDNEIYRVASKKEWLDTEESRQRALKEQKERDKEIKCYVCEFIKKLKEQV